LIYIANGRGIQEQDNQEQDDMRHGHHRGCGRHFHQPDDDRAHFHHPGSRFGRGRRGGRHGRMFDYGELRLLVLAMIAEEPRHGYELIKAIEERFGGSYSPSPGVIYPTLAWLDDMGYAAIEPEPSGRKLYRITGEGEAFLTTNRAAADELLGRASDADGEGVDGAPAQVLRAMQNLRLAMRLRLRRGGMDQATAEKLAAILDAAAQTVERS
jgi:DNA-binding PadR family transcriptional regulator